ncbi:carbonic anhydrase IV c, partial [Trichomycterus rosablanca]|uniref:carbonic anhydrase IV c n=1 Tax=Trichomycterus rosablanca TaxID=2290929 RepID=UPI002F359EDC
FDLGTPRFATADMWSTLLVMCLLLAPGIYSVQWCYHSQYSCQDQCRKPDKWFLDVPTCGGQKQSPINIVTNKVQFDPSLSPIIFENYTQVLNITVWNVGYAAVFGLPPSARIRGGGLPATYKAIQFHLHWGVTGGLGSEHTVDGEQYPMEVHIVHIKEQYETLKQAMEDQEGLAVLGFFFEVSSDENQQFNKVIEALQRVPYNGNSRMIPEFRLTDMMTSIENLSSYYRYSGSLTTPSCDETVIWTVFQRSVPISHQQLNNLTEAMFIETGQPMTDTFRPVQKLNGRMVYKSMANASSRCGCVLSLPLILLKGLIFVFGMKE